MMKELNTEGIVEIDLPVISYRVFDQIEIEKEEQGPEIEIQEPEVEEPHQIEEAPENLIEAQEEDREQLFSYHETSAMKGSNS